MKINAFRHQSALSFLSLVVHHFVPLQEVSSFLMVFSLRPDED